MKRGKLIRFLGIEGAGKSTQAILFQNYLLSKNIPVGLLREPGGTKEAEAIRSFFLDSSRSEKDELNFNKLSKLYLLQVARNELYEKIILPGIEKGISYIQDRGEDCSLAYQGYGWGMDKDFIKKLNLESTYRLKADLGIVIDIDPEIGLMNETTVNSMSQEKTDFYQRAREGYLEIAKENPDNYIVIPWEKGIDKIQSLIKPSIDKLFDF